MDGAAWYGALMPRFLKTLYPCRDCQSPVRVPNQRHIPFAICDPCLERKNLLQRAGWADEEAGREFLKVNEQTEDAVELVVGCLRAVQAASRASEHWLTALRRVRPEEVRRVARLAKDRAAWAADLLGQLDAFCQEIIEVEGERAPVRGAITGGGEAPLPTTRATLSLVRVTGDRDVE